MQIAPISSNWSYLFIFGRRETLDLIVTIYQHWFYIFLLAITIPYSQCPGGRQPLGAGIPLADKGNMIGYSQYFPSPFVGLAGEVGRENLLRT